MNDTLTASEMLLTGKHGRTGEELFRPQDFKVTIEVTLDCRKAIEHDDLSRTVDYCDLERVARSVVEGESCALIETLAGRIADMVLHNHREVSLVRVTVTKLQTPSGAQPTFICTRDRVAESLGLYDFDPGKVVHNLATVGGISIPLLPERRREELVVEARTHRYVDQPKEVGRHKVHEEVSSSEVFTEDSPFHRLRQNVQALLSQRLLQQQQSYWGPNPFSFNDVVLQKFLPGSIGVTPHREGRSKINLFCVIILCGDGKTAICSNRKGDNPIFLDTTPGNALLFRGLGFMGMGAEEDQPLHFLTDVTSERITFCLRQRVGEKTQWKK